MSKSSLTKEIEITDKRCIDLFFGFVCFIAVFFLQVRVRRPGKSVILACASPRLTTLDCLNVAHDKTGERKEERMYGTITRGRIRASATLQ